MKCLVLPTVLFIALVPLATGPVAAQPAPPVVVQPSATEQLTALNALVKKIRDTPDQAPETSLAQYREFLKTPMLPADIARLCAERIMWLQYRRLNDIEGALATGKQVQQAYADNVEVGIYLQAQAANILVAANRLAEAGALVKGQWQRVPKEASAYAFQTVLKPVIAIMEKQDKADEIVTTLSDVMIARPILLDTSDRGPSEGAANWFYDKLIDTLIDAGRFDEALGWAKLRLTVSTTDEPAIKTVTDGVAHVYTSKTLKSDIADGFRKAFEDDKLKNPLADVKLPKIEQAKIDAGQEYDTRNAQPQWLNHDKYSLLIASGNVRRAMVAAKRALMEKPDSKFAIAEISRIFKAADLNMVRSRAFPDAYKNGTGAEMINAFLAQAAAAPLPDSAAKATPDKQE